MLHLGSMNVSVPQADFASGVRRVGSRKRGCPDSGSPETFSPKVALSTAARNLRLSDGARLVFEKKCGPMRQLFCFLRVCR